MTTMPLYHRGQMIGLVGKKCSFVSATVEQREVGTTKTIDHWAPALLFFHAEGRRQQPVTDLTVNASGQD